MNEAADGAKSGTAREDPGCVMPTSAMGQEPGAPEEKWRHAFHNHPGLRILASLIAKRIMEDARHEAWEPQAIENDSNSTEASQDLVDGSEHDVTSTMEAARLFEKAIAQLRHDYATHRFFTERDIVRVVQMQLLSDMRENQTDLLVHDNHRMPNRKLVDLAIVHPQGEVLCVAEFKYEPDHGRKDIAPGKLNPSKVFWGARTSGVIQDMECIEVLVRGAMCGVGYTIFIDEGEWFDHRAAPGDSKWENWGKSPYSEKMVRTLCLKKGR